MATGFDKLIDYLLSEIALCGVQGAGSADFHRFIQTFYGQSQTTGDSTVASKSDSGLPLGGLGRTFHERVWDWVCTHSDIRITYKDEIKHYSLSEFEAAELGETGETDTTGATSITGRQPPETSTNRTIQPSKCLLGLRDTLRERLSKEGHDSRTLTTVTTQASTSTSLRRIPRNIPKRPHAATPVFDEPESTIAAPRLYASQNRIWQALTGHGIDLKKVPSMEFALLSLIAAHGANGITQPDLTRLSGQDKRSVPHRTNELVRKGYIVKNPVQAGKIRTSLCVHTKFISQGHFLSSGAVEDVYQEGTFVLSGFVQLLYSKLQGAGIVPTRNIRKLLGVPMTTWNKRATQGALIRLDQTGMIKRFRVRKKHSEDSWATCIQVLREPREEDVNNLGFRRQNTAMDETVDELLDEDVDGDTLMRDLEVDVMDDDDVEASTNADPQHALEDFGRIPPQWSPDRFLANIVYDVVALGGANGLDAGMLRDRIVGPFWRRPLETYVTRMSDDWEKTQPLPIRHLAIIRDTRNTQEKKFIHYVYRTYENFQKAVEIGEVHWEGVSKAVSKEKGRPKKNTTEVAALNTWGFPNFNPKDFVRSDGSATLSEVRSAIVHPRKYGPRWDNALTQKIGYEKTDTPVTKMKSPRTKSVSQQRLNGDDPVAPSPRLPKMTKSKTKSPKKVPNLSLTPEQRISLGLKPNGRLSKSAEQQILDHRQRTGDPTSLPEKIEEGISQRGQQAPLMTAEERIAQGLPARGRLGIAVENKIREERGLAKLQKKSKKPEKKLFKEPALLTKEQRLAFGWKGHGRLPQDLIDGLREERDNGISLEDSTVLPKYMDIMKAKATSTVPSEVLQSEEGYAASPMDRSSALGEDSHGKVPETGSLDVEALASLPPTSSGKRKARDTDLTSHATKKQRTDTGLSREKSATTVSSHSLESPNGDVASVVTPDGSTSATTMPIIDEVTERATLTPVQGADINQRVTHPAYPPDGAQQPFPAPPTKDNIRTPLPSSMRSVLVQPDASSLEPRARRIFERYMSRSASGVYMNPFAKHRARGRPRKAFIATFRLPRLQAYDWFKPALSHLQDSHQSTGIEVLKPSLKNDAQPNEHNESPPAGLNSDVPLLSGTVLQSTSAIIAEDPHTALQADTNADGHPSVTTVSAIPMPTTIPGIHNVNLDEQAHAESASSEARALATAVADDKEEIQEQSESGAEQVKQPTEKVADPSQVEGEVNFEQLLGQQLLTATTNDESEAPAQPSLQQALLVNRSSAGSATINSSMLHNPSPYQSPYGPSPRSNSTPPSQTAANVTSTNVSVTSASRPRTPLGEENENAPLPEGVYSAISEVQTPPPPKLKPRAKRDHPMEGSGLLFRRQIIREIIDLCKGVFPDSGEIGRPFHKLWVERHGHKENVKEPIASTVNTTMRNMCINPNFGLKRMVFLVKNKYGPSTSEKAMITYSHYTPRSPEVLQLAYKIANFSLEKSHQYFPEEIRHLVDDTSLYYPVQLAPKDESIVLNQLNPELEAHIKEAQKRRRKELARHKRMEDRARKAQNAQVEQAPSKKINEADGGPHTKRARLASLNDRNKRYRRALLPKSGIDSIDDENEEQENEDPDSAAHEHSKGVSLIWTRPWIAPIVNRGTPDHEEESSVETEESDDDSLHSPANETHKIAANDHGLRSSMHTPVEVSPINSTVPAEPERTVPTNGDIDRTEDRADTSTTAQESKKRIRIADLSTQRLQKKARHSTAKAPRTPGADAAHNLGSQSDTSSSFNAVESDEHEAALHTKTKRRVFRGRQRGKPGPLPTLLERLTGLTGDPNDPIYQPPIRKERDKRIPRPWSEKKKHQANKEKKARRYTEILDPVDQFSKLCCTLVIASSMLGELGVVDWSIVEKVYSDDKFFDVARTKRLWTWMQYNMAVQLAEFTAKFQSSFLEAYSDGKFAAIEDPETYDWTSIVRWAMRYGGCPEIPLPAYRESLRQFVIDESSYENLDRLNWYQKKIANRVRTELQLHYTFTAPLHRPRRSDWSSSDKILKARSWVRANTATPQTLYSGNQAHDKLMALGTPILTSVVGDLVEKQSMRMRQLKRLLPGRNYTFTKTFAKRYVRPFELDDFMAAVRAKKGMDTAFAKQDRDQRFFNVSRSERDGSVMAILCLVSEGRVKLVPQLPSVNNEFGAPLPRLSVWGFCEGDYIHRAIDRNRLFWDIHVVPTADYEFGNPLQPLPSPLVQTEIGESAAWPPLPIPPLPGKKDPDALLPIWSSIDGQSITWAWWYRILNLVLQPLIFQPGATSTDIYAHCPEHTTEMFEIELVLEWLESINGISKLPSGGYITKPGIWAALGDKLIDTEDDWFGEHVKRKAKNHEKQRWREDYNLRHSTLQRGNAQQVDDGHLVAEQTQGLDDATQEQILQHPRRQYRIMQQVLNSSTPQPENGTPDSTAPPGPAADVQERAEIEQTAGSEQLTTIISQTSDIQYTTSQDVDLPDVEGEDVDAEGEVDDAMY
ncbi:Nn.00g104420.m01.CDS01 [Neocucurbitaria sp. VM-36]